MMVYIPICIHVTPSFLEEMADRHEGTYVQTL